MKAFFVPEVLLSTPTAVALYEGVKDIPIIDYHCHLNEKEIEADKRFTDLGELWLGGDHYKWRAMRLCGIDEYYITGGASFREKFDKYASIFPPPVRLPAVLLDADGAVPAVRRLLRQRQGVYEAVNQR